MENGQGRAGWRQKEGEGGGVALHPECCGLGGHSYPECCGLGDSDEQNIVAAMMGPCGHLLAPFQTICSGEDDCHFVGTLGQPHVVSARVPSHQITNCSKELGRGSLEVESRSPPLHRTAPSGPQMPQSI